MKATIEHSFCPYCDEVTELYFRIINTILFSTDEAELRTGMERLQEKTRLDDYSCRFCGLTAETRTIVPVDGLHFHFPCNYGFPLIFRIVFRRSHHHFPMQR